ncbi:MAG: LOG family protein [bacterium]
MKKYFLIIPFLIFQFVEKICSQLLIPAGVVETGQAAVVLFDPSVWSDNPDRIVEGINGERIRANEIYEQWKNPAIVVYGGSAVPRGHKYYELSIETGKVIWNSGFSIRSGAGPGIMEGCSIGANEARGKRHPSNDVDIQGIRIQLPFEQKTNRYVDVVEYYNYMITRKLALSLNTKGAVFFPGGPGTFDEFFEEWRRNGLFVLMGSDFWIPFVNALSNSLKSAEIYVGEFPKITDSPEEAINYIKKKSEKKRVTHYDKKRIIRINKEFTEDMQQLSRLSPAITFLGNPKNNHPALKNLEDLIYMLLDSRMPVRTGSKGALFETVSHCIRDADDLHSLQIAMMASPKRRRMMVKKEVLNYLFPTSDVNHRVLLVENSKAFIFIPGGIETMCQLFDFLDLMKCEKIQDRPIILMDRSFWQPIVDALNDIANNPNFPVIEPQHLESIHVADTANEVFNILIAKGVVPSTKFAANININRISLRKDAVISNSN